MFCLHKERLWYKVCSFSPIHLTCNPSSLHGVGVGTNIQYILISFSSFPPLHPLYPLFLFAELRQSLIEVHIVQITHMALWFYHSQKKKLKAMTNEDLIFTVLLIQAKRSITFSIPILFCNSKILVSIWGFSHISNKFIIIAYLLRLLWYYLSWPSLRLLNKQLPHALLCLVSMDQVPYGASSA